MKTLSKLALSTAFLFLVVASTTYAAFPVEKLGTHTATVSALPVTGEKAQNRADKAELKKGLKKLKKDKTYWYAGGKSKITAALLAFFLGGLGVHSFYMGNKKKGFVQLGLTILGIVLYLVGIVDFVSGMGESFPTLALLGAILLLGVSLWALVDFIRILTGGLEPEEGFDS
ncbi:MAG: TM2 domain-containing protein [Ginsengibacter sp.]